MPIAFPSAGIRWTTVDRDILRKALVTNDLQVVRDWLSRQAASDEREIVQRKADVVKTADPELERLLAEEEEIERRHHSHPAPKPENNGSTTGSIDALIRDIARRAAEGSIDETKVRSIVKEEISQSEDAITSLIEEGLSSLRPHKTIVAIPDRPVVEIDGRQHAQFPNLIKVLSVRCHAYLVGPPGTGKTTLAHRTAEALGIPFYAISCSPTMLDSRLFGYMDANGNYVPTNFRSAYEHGGVFLLDEIDNGHPGIVAAMNQSLANDYCAFPDGMIKRHADFICIAAANTYGTGATRQFIGRNQLDAATLDRFVTLFIDIDLDLEHDLTIAQLPDNPSLAEEWLAKVRQYRSNVASHNLEIVISPRASIEGAKLLSAGIDVAQVVEMRIAKGMTEDQRRKVLA